jgi:hypothetical protein
MIERHFVESSMKYWKSSLMLGVTMAVILCAATVAVARPDDKASPAADPAHLSAPANPDKAPAGAADNSDYVGTDSC